jgi:hypothetical protein
MLTQNEIIEEITRQVSVLENDCKTPRFIICDTITYETLTKTATANKDFDGNVSVHKDKCHVRLNWTKYGKDLWATVHSINYHQTDDNRTYFLHVLAEEDLVYYEFIRQSPKRKK